MADLIVASVEASMPPAKAPPKRKAITATSGSRKRTKKQKTYHAPEEEDDVSPEHYEVKRLTALEMRDGVEHAHVVWEESLVPTTSISKGDMVTLSDGEYKAKTILGTEMRAGVEHTRVEWEDSCLPLSWLNADGLLSELRARELAASQGTGGSSHGLVHGDVDAPIEGMAHVTAEPLTEPPQDRVATSAGGEHGGSDALANDAGARGPEAGCADDEELGPDVVDEMEAILRDRANEYEQFLNTQDASQADPFADDLADLLVDYADYTEDTATTAATNGQPLQLA